MRIILIDESKEFMAQLRRCLARAFPDVEITEYDPDQQGKPPENFDWSLYDALLMSLELGSGQGGLDWLTEFKTRPFFPPVIAMSHTGGDYVAVQALKAGACDYIRKADIESERLVDIVNQAVKRTQLSGSASDKPSCKLDQDAEVVARATGEDASIPDGQRIGYRFVRLIGQGASSRVYLAERNRDQLTLVLKIIDVDTITDSTVLKRFVQEAEIISELDSPYVVRFIEHGITSSYGFIGMEFFTRGDLKQRIEYFVPVEEALNYVLHIAYGLEAIHDVGIVHRDLKPGNIMFRSDDSLALADFGISKRIDRTTGMTDDGSVIGTPNYISPEQATPSAMSASRPPSSGGRLRTKPPLAPTGTITAFFTVCAFIRPSTSVRKSSRRSDQRMPPLATLPPRRCTASTLGE